MLYFIYVNKNENNFLEVSLLPPPLPPWWWVDGGRVRGKGHWKLIERNVKEEGKGRESGVPLCASRFISRYEEF
jgi:hypothetical protein